MNINMNISFISGHLDLSNEEFNSHYIPLINENIKHNSWFLIGDARGADEKAQSYLHSLNYNNTIIFHMLQKPRIFIGNFFLFGGFINDSERDTAMTILSNKDIAWIRPGRENSGTAKNIQRRSRLNIGRYCFDHLSIHGNCNHCVSPD